ncbi:MAG: hypothetical protein ABJE95_08380 [Byssovorax sp.]
MTSANDVSENEFPLTGLPTSAIGTVVMLLLIVGLGVFFLFDGIRGAFAGLGVSFLIKEILKGVAVWGIAGYLFVARKVPGIFSARDRIRDRPGDVVWVFEKVIHRGGAISRELMIGFIDGQLLGWSLPAPLAEQPTVRGWVERHLTHATIGHTPERARQFAASPRDLLHP